MLQDLAFPASPVSARPALAVLPRRVPLGLVPRGSAALQDEPPVKPVALEPGLGDWPAALALWQAVGCFDAARVDEAAEHLLGALRPMFGAGLAVLQGWVVREGSWQPIGSGIQCGETGPDHGGPRLESDVLVADGVMLRVTLVRAQGAASFEPAERQFLAVCLSGATATLRWLALSHGWAGDQPPLRPHHRRVLLGLLTGLSEKQVAYELNLSVNTTHEYVTTLLRRFKVRNRPSLMALWLCGA